MPDESTTDKPESTSQGANAITEGEVEFLPGATRQMYYANHGQVSLSLFEIQLLLNFVQGVNPKTRKLSIVNHLTVILAPELAAAVYKALGNALTNYEKQFGPLRQPDITGRISETGRATEVPHDPPPTES